jgi:hypothetical protein
MTSRGHPEALSKVRNGTGSRCPHWRWDWRPALGAVTAPARDPWTMTTFRWRAPASGRRRCRTAVCSHGGRRPLSIWSDPTILRRGHDLPAGRLVGGAETVSLPTSGRAPRNAPAVTLLRAARADV